MIPLEQLAAEREDVLLGLGALLDGRDLVLCDPKDGRDHRQGAGGLEEQHQYARARLGRKVEMHLTRE